MLEIVLKVRISRYQHVAVGNTKCFHFGVYPNAKSQRKCVLVEYKLKDRQQEAEGHSCYLSLLHSYPMHSITSNDSIAYCLSSHTNDVKATRIITRNGLHLYVLNIPSTLMKYRRYSC